MSSFLLTNVLDAARALGSNPYEATPASVCSWFETEYLGKKGGRFNYDPASRAAYDLFRGAAPLSGAIDYCQNSGNPKGRAQNVSAVKAIGEYALSHISRCHKIGFLAVEVGRAKGKSVYLGIKAPFIRVRGTDARVVMPGFRMSHEPSEAEIDVACGIVKAHLARDDYSAADIEYLYAGKGADGKRTFRAVVGQDRDLPSIDNIDALLQVYVGGINLLLDRGAEVRAPSFRGYSRRSFDEPLMV